MSGEARHLLMRTHYKRMVTEYFRRRFIEPKDIMVPRVPNVSIPAKIVWSTYHWPVLLAGMLASDEVSGVFLDSNYKWIQFEYMWANEPDSMSALKCWVTRLARCNVNQNESSVKNFSARATRKPVSDWFIAQIQRIFTPCTSMAISGVLKDRPGLLLGEWLRWYYFT